MAAPKSTQEQTAVTGAQSGSPTTNPDVLQSEHSQQHDASQSRAPNTTGAEIAQTAGSHNGQSSRIMDDQVVGNHSTQAPEATTQATKPASTHASSTTDSSDSDDVSHHNWGERREGRVSEAAALENFNEMRRELSNLSKTTSARSQRSRGLSLHPSRVDRTPSQQQTPGKELSDASTTPDLEAGASKEEGIAGGDHDNEDFNLAEFLRSGAFEARTAEGDSAKRVGVTFKDLTVIGAAGGSVTVKTLYDAIKGTFGPDLYKIICHFIPALRFGNHGNERELIRNFSGAVRDGEMMIVLGRPGSGCSTFLKAVANNRHPFLAVKGDVTYGGISAAEQAKHYRGEVIYNQEDDQHLPTLTVGQTLEFSLLNKTKKRDSKAINIIVDSLLRMFAISHTKNTLVGNEMVPGVSGGERKRVSIAEALATRSSVTAWDNSTRGLDGSTALDYARSLRILTDIGRHTTFTTLYQAGEEIYQLMDKVLVIEDGRMIYQGPANEARQYFVDLGFEAPQQQTTADFLTSIGDAEARSFRPGCEASTPKTPAELEAAFQSSPAFQKVLADMNNYERQLEQTNHRDTQNFQSAVRASKSHRTVPAHSSYTVSFPRQVMACLLREYWLLVGDRTALYTKAFIIVANGLIVGSLFYQLGNDTSAAFPRGGAVFFSIVFLGWLQLTELMKAVGGRGVIGRHREYAFYRPSAVNIARLLLDFPVLLIQVIIFGIIMYFMTNLRLDPSNFFIYLLFVYTTTISITALYRMFASVSPTINEAVRYSGVALNLCIIYAGYVIPKSTLLSSKIWFGWGTWINPMSYAFEGALGNELAGREMPCNPAQLVPQGPGVQSQYQGCAVTGASLSSTVVSGDDYLADSFGYSRAYLWRDWGVLVVLTVGYLIITMVASEVFDFEPSGGGSLVFKKTRHVWQYLIPGARRRANSVQAPAAKVQDTEKGDVSHDRSLQPQETNTSALGRTTTGVSARRTRTHAEALKELTRSERVVTWSHINLTVPTPAGPKQLLDDVSGYAKPGLLVALMGASGAGKTTLLRTLSNRGRIGVVTGDVRVDGRPPGADFERGTGFVEQLDLTDFCATVREALSFSAILRQERSIPREKKLEYVDTIIDLLELGPIEDALISSLSLEQRKRCSIGIELAAKPSLLLFLDEPTSGLDSQAALSLVHFLRRLCRAGQAIVCTIHQPSSMLIEQFDMILALNPGGHVFYFGPVGRNGQNVIDYFDERGVHCPPHKNVAEFILETAAKVSRGRGGKKIDWNREWRESKEQRQVLVEIEGLEAERSTVPLSESHESATAFAAPVKTQCVELTKRLWTQYWRSPSYLYSKIFTSVTVGLFNGFTFWKLGSSTADMQDRLFTCFLIIMIPPAIVNTTVPKFYQNRALWEFRELPARMYGWFAFCTANIITELPFAVVGAVLYWVLWYWATGLPTDSSTSGYVFFMVLLMFIFISSWGQWICAFAPSFTVISNTLPFFFVTFGLFNGIVVPYFQLNVFWRYWMYYVNPSTWWISGVLSKTLPGIPVQCTDSEAAHFNPPPGITCEAYAGQFVQQAGRGYLLNPSDTSNCGYCQFANGSEYLASLNISPNDAWRDLGIFCCYLVSNWFLVYFFIYTCRIKRWSFGLSFLFSLPGKAVGAIKKVVKRS